LLLQAVKTVLPRRPSPEAVDLVMGSGGLALVGGSGEGKSLLCRLVLGEEPRPPLRWVGGLVLDGAPVAPRDLLAHRGQRITWLPQGGRECLVPGWSLRRHLALLAPGERGDAVLRGMETLGLDPGERILQSSATQLSEGMIRRFLLALAVSGAPELILLDEPTAGLDPGSRDAVVSLVRERVLERGAGLVVATHDLDLASALADRFCLVRSGAPVALTSTLTDDGPLGSLVRAHRELVQ